MKYKNIAIQLYLLLLLMVMNTTVFGQTVMPLYNGNVPNLKHSKQEETIVIGADGGERVSHVSVPTLKAYFPAKPNGRAVIICPGGGYTRLSITKEGDSVAKLLSEEGITAFVLKYRLPNDTLMYNKQVVPFQDAQAAILLVRLRASEWKLQSNKIGLMGFSAGGHLAAITGTHFDTAFI